MNTSQHFTGKAVHYDAVRPSYPNSLLTELRHRYHWTPASIIADIGAGTGIWTAQMLQNGLQVIAVEPNVDMRKQAEQRLFHEPLFTSIAASAEQTTLLERSIDHITVAQAFHWFDSNLFQRECRRILHAHGHVSLIWNNRDITSDIMLELAAICTQYCPSFTGFSAGFQQHDDSFRPFFRDGQYEQLAIPYDLTYTLDQFIRRNLSASYAPLQHTTQYVHFIEQLTNLFSKYESNEGIVTIINHCHCYSGQV